jgi:anti-anti-sigma factor
VTHALARGLAGLGPGDHACWSFDSSRDWDAMVGRFARDGLGRGDRVVYLADRSAEEDLRERFASAGIDVDRRLASGQLEIGNAAGAYGDGGGLDPERQIVEFERQKHEAMGAGYSGLSVMAEMTWVLDRPSELEPLLVYENELRGLFAKGGLTGVCQYDSRAFSSTQLEDLVCAHDVAVSSDPRGSSVRRGPVTIVESADGATLALHGELDMSVASYLAARLEEHLDSGSDVLLDVSGLAFADVAACRTLAEAAGSLGGGRRLVLRDVSPHIARVFRICGWGQDPQLELATNETAA